LTDKRAVLGSTVNGLALLFRGKHGGLTDVGFEAKRLLILYRRGG